MLESRLISTGLFAGCVLPVALLTSVAAMELSSFVLTIATIGLFAMEARANPRAALARLQCPATLPLCGFLVLTLISLAVNVDDASEHWSAIRDQRWIVYFFVYLYFLQRFFAASWQLAVSIFSVTLTLVATFAVLQFFYGWELPREQSVLDRWDAYYRVTGVFNVPQTFASNIGMAAFMLTGVTVVALEPNNAQAARRQVTGATAAILGFVGIVLSLTRGAWLAAAVTLIYGAGRLRRAWAVYALLGLAVLTGLGYASNTVFHDRIGNDNELNEKSIEHRQSLWSANLHMITDFPLLGVGPEQNVGLLEDYYAKTAHSETDYIGHAHNNLLEVWVGQGVFALACYLWFSLYFLRAANRVASNPTASVLARGLALGSLYAQVYFHLAGLADSNFLDREVKNMIVVIWGLSAALDMRLTQPQDPMPDSSSQSQTGN